MHWSGPDASRTASFWDGLPQPIIGLSPMDGVTDAAFRFTVSQQAKPDVTVTEFTSVHDLCFGPARMLSPLVYHECERPIMAQLYGKDPHMFYVAAHMVCELGFDGLDVNMGCPSRNVAASGSGAGLIRTPALALEILRAAQQGVADWASGQTPPQAGLKPSREQFLRDMNLDRIGCPTVPRRLIPVSVKTRIGYDSVVIEEWIDHLLQAQPAAISVHGRTLEQMYRGEADWEAIARAARRVRGTGTLLLGNGDLRSMESVVRRVRTTGVHGVLVGRGTLGSPWFFRNKAAARTAAREAGPERTSIASPGVPDGAWDVVLSLQERFRVMQVHARRFEAVFGRGRFPRMRKHLGWYCKGFPRAAAMRDRMVRACSSVDVDRIVEEYLALQSPSAAPEPEFTATGSVATLPAGV